MKKRQLGHSGIEVPALCFGGNVIGWTADEKRSFELLDELLANGLNFIDTADTYPHWAPGHEAGESETIIGKWFKARGNRSKVILATKVGSSMGQGKKGLSKKYIRAEVEESLKRLQTDYIDLYQSHRDDENTPQLETMETFANLIKEGKVRAIGCSNFTAERLESALEVSRKHNLPRYETLQPEYNLYDRAGFEHKLEGVCVKHGLGVISYFSLASGFLSGKYRSAEQAGTAARAGFLKKYFTERGMRILQTLDAVAHDLKAKPAQVALAWLIARPSITAPIASATTVEQLHELVEATKFNLPPGVIEKLNHASVEPLAA
ncbi:MAG: alcohol dehydrogenase [Acidobacteria bacterium]|nr:MAG: alcohol dehydrogenase [Acidobacteriota bacterium]